MDVDPCPESVEDGFPSVVEHASRACGEITTFLLTACAHPATTLTTTKEPTPSPAASASLGDTCIRCVESAMMVRVPAPESAHLAGSTRNPLETTNGLTIQRCPTLSAVTLSPTEYAQSWSSCDQCQAARDRDPHPVEIETEKAAPRAAAHMPLTQPMSTVTGSKLAPHKLQTATRKGPSVRYPGDIRQRM